MFLSWPRKVLQCMFVNYAKDIAVNAIQDHQWVMMDCFQSSHLIYQGLNSVSLFPLFMFHAWVMVIFIPMLRISNLLASLEYIFYEFDSWKIRRGLYAFKWLFWPYQWTIYIQWLNLLCVSDYVSYRRNRVTEMHHPIIFWFQSKLGQCGVNSRTFLSRYGLKQPLRFEGHIMPN